MGQRLVITVRKDNCDIATIYYHWSAYSVVALMETKELIDYIEENHINEIKDLDNIRLKLIEFCESNEGGVSNNDIEFAENKFGDIHKFKDRDSVSRNCGLIDFSDIGMSTSKGWSEGDICVDLDNMIICNDVYYMYENYEKFIECYGDDDGGIDSVDDIPLYNCGNIGNIEFDEINDVIRMIDCAPHFFRTESGLIYELIE